jgi:D-serine deaminase-like pyridoxal phosphate-dependent protein
MDAERVFAAAQAVETPVAVVDVAAMESNLAAMQSRAAGLGLRLRPHAKTHKSAFVARRQLEHGATGLTAATLTEAEVFAAAGAGDLLIAFPPVGEMKLRRLAALAERVGRLAVSTDSVEVAATLPERVEVLWEVDSGHHRVGTAPGAATVAGVTALVAAIGVERFRGLLTFPGHAYAVADRAELARVAEAEHRVMLETAAQLRAAGIAVRELSVGSTPTASWTEAGPTEIRPGSYVYGDAQQVVLGAMTVEECALGVVATVVSTPAPDRAVIDAGSKALAADARPVPAPRLRERGRARGPGAGEDERGARDARRHGWPDRAAHRRPPPGHPGPLLHHGQPPSGRADGRGGDGMVGPGGGARLAGNSRRDARPSGGG